MDFAVTVKGRHKEGEGSWVPAVDGGRVLISHDDDRTLHWYPMEDCMFLKAGTPDKPRLVMVVQPQPGKGIVVAGANRAARRRGENGAQ